MTRLEQLENALLSLASHGRVILAFAQADLLTADVVATSAALFDAAAVLATDRGDEAAADDAHAATHGDCPHPLDRRIELGGMGEPDVFFCKVCKQHVAPVALGVGAPGC